MTKNNVIDAFPKFSEHLKEQLKNAEYAKLWVQELLEEYSSTKDINSLLYDLKPLIETSYTICAFAEKIGVHRITLYKIFSRKMLPSLEVLNKIFSGLGYNLSLKIS